MQAIADKVHEAVLIEPIDKIVEFVARLYIAEKGTHRIENPVALQKEKQLNETLDRGT